MFLKFYNIFNYVTIVIVAIFLVLILTETVSRDMYVTLLIITIIILIARIGLRIYLHFYIKQSKGE